MKIYKINGSFLMEVIDLSKDLKGANLSGADLSWANLINANLKGANLKGANLINANLRRVNLEGANLIDADLSGAYLSGANLRWANLKGADLEDANLSGANLSNANLRRVNLEDANLSGAKYNVSTSFPSPGQVLLANWGEVSDSLTVKLMNYDCQNHPIGKKAFDQWVKDNTCPYTDCEVQRAANFKEKKELWVHKRARPSALSLMRELMKEKMSFVD